MTHNIPNLLPDDLEPAWDVARLFPAQGAWSEAEFLGLPGNQLSEFDHGRVEVLTMRSELHQLVVAWLFRALLDSVSRTNLGTVLFAPFPIKLWEGKIREPDIVFMRHEHAERRRPNLWQGADLVMEVISPGDVKRDTETKRREYAMASIPEYWLVDPNAKTVTVMELEGDRDQYAVRGIYTVEDLAESAFLTDFSIEVGVMFAEVDSASAAR